MKFVSPPFLFALFAIAIPIIIHLFNFRKFKKVFFTNVKFLKEVKQETQSKSRLRHLLVLISRILGIALLVFAFAQPYLPVNNALINTGEKAISIFIDNSFSMDALNSSGRLLDNAKEKALEIVAAYKATDRFQILTNDFEASHQRLVNKEEFVELLDEIKITPAVRNVSEIALRQFDVLNNNPNKNKKSFIISDFQKSISDFNNLKNDTGISVNLIPIVSAKRSNVFIDSCWFSSPIRQFNQTEQLYVRIKNNSENNIENNSIKLFINGQQKIPASFTVEAESKTTVVLSFSSKETGIQHCKIEITDYPITFDDAFYFSFQVANHISILNINSSELSGTSDQQDYINSLYGKDSLFILKNVFENKLDYAALAQSKLIILNELKNISTGLAQELKRFVSNGGSLLIFPNKKIDEASYKEFLISLKTNYYQVPLDTAATTVEQINFEHNIFKDIFEKKNESIDLPTVKAHYTFSKNMKSNEAPILKLRNGEAFLSEYQFEKGKIYLSGVSLNSSFSNFGKHAIFVPILYKIAIYSQAESKLFYTIGNDDEQIEIPGTTTTASEHVFHIKSINNDFEIIPESKIESVGTSIFLHHQISQAGNYNLFEGNENNSALAFNYDRKESDLSCYTDDELISKYTDLGMENFSLLDQGSKSLTQTLSEINQGKKLWKLCIILALIFFGLEVILLRFWKKN